MALISKAWLTPAPTRVAPAPSVGDSLYPGQTSGPMPGPSGPVYVPDPSREKASHRKGGQFLERWKQLYLDTLANKSAFEAAKRSAQALPIGASYGMDGAGMNASTGYYAAGTYAMPSPGVVGGGGGGYVDEGFAVSQPAADAGGGNSTLFLIVAVGLVIFTLLRR